MGLSWGASATLGTLASGSGVSFSVLSLSEKFSAVLESSDEDSHLGKRDKWGRRDAADGIANGGEGVWGSDYRITELGKKATAEFKTSHPAQ